jgi:hypothetical protein
MNHIKNLQSKRSHLSIENFDFGYTELEEVFSHYGHAYMLAGSINRSEYYLGNSSEGEQCYDDIDTFNDLALYWIDEDGDLVEIELSEQDIIELIF